MICRGELLVVSTIKESTSPAIRVLREHEIDFREHSYIYRYQEKNVASAASQEPGLDEHVVIKTLVMEDDRKQPFVALMQGDKQVSTKALARALKVKSVNPCSPMDAQRHTGYMVGGDHPSGRESTSLSILRSRF